MKDYYKILGISPEATTADIRRAYRRKAKDVHPDVATASRSPEADFILIREAYDVLVSPEIRAEYDHVYSRLFKKKEGFRYRDFLLAHSDEMEFRVKLICFDLLHNNEDNALELFLSLGARPVHTLSGYLDVEDFMDFGFIIADEFFMRRSYETAFVLFYEIALLEEDRPYFRHFYPELLDRMREITRRRFRGSNTDEKKLRMLEKLVDLAYPAGERALIHRQISEILLAHGEKAVAREHFSLALSLNPKLPGREKLVEKLGLSARRI